MDTKIRYEWMAMVAVALFLWPGQADAQDPWADTVSNDTIVVEDRHVFTAEARGGLGIPVGDLGDVVNTGPAIGGGIGFFLGPRTVLRLDVDYQDLNEQDFDLAEPFDSGPGIQLLSYTGGLEFLLTEPASTGATVTANIGAGGTSFESDEFPTVDDELTEFSESYFTAVGGLKLGADLVENVTLFASGQYYVIFADEDDTDVFALFREDDPEGFDTVSSIPLTLGLRVQF